MTHGCNDMLEVDGDQVYLVCELPHGHDGHHAAGGTDALDGRPYAAVWARTPDTITGEVIDQ